LHAIALCGRYHGRPKERLFLVTHTRHSLVCSRVPLGCWVVSCVCCPVCRMPFLSGGGYLLWAHRPGMLLFNQALMTGFWEGLCEHCLFVHGGPHMCRPHSSGLALSSKSARALAKKSCTCMLCRQLTVAHSLLPGSNMHRILHLVGLDHGLELYRSRDLCQSIFLLSDAERALASTPSCPSETAGQAARS
jgi:hypothetical protein